MRHHLIPFLLVAACKSSPTSAPRSTITTVPVASESDGSAAVGSGTAASSEPAASTRETMPTADRERLVHLGESVYERKGCNACHTTDGSAKYGASFAGLWGTKVTLADGTMRVVDQQFIRDALVNPHVVRQAGYRDVMPNFAGNVEPDEIQGLAAFIQSLRPGK